VIGDPALAKGEVSEVADILDGGVLHDELVHRERGDVEEDSRDEHGDDARYPSKNRERPRLCHYRKAHLIT
jgi:hypothetical protein